MLFFFNIEYWMKPRKFWQILRNVLTTKKSAIQKCQNLQNKYLKNTGLIRKFTHDGLHLVRVKYSICFFMKIKKFIVEQDILTKSRTRISRKRLFNKYFVS